MKLALITDPRGFSVVDQFQMSYHLVLAQYVRMETKYSDYYREKGERGCFLMMDNGAAENLQLKLHELKSAAELIRPDEIILPDVLADSVATLEATKNPEVLEFVPPRQRAVVPQGDTFDSWLHCANNMVNEMDFATMCVPKHTERFPGGRPTLLSTIEKLGWHKYYNIHLLGIWGNPKTELAALKEFKWVRGIDTAAPFAWAQHKLEIFDSDTLHVSHTWGKRFDRTLAFENVNNLWSKVWSY